MDIEEEEKKTSTSKERRVNCVYVQKSNLNETRKCLTQSSKQDSKEFVNKSQVGKSMSGVLPLKSDCVKRSPDINVTVDSPGKIKRCTFFKKSNLDYMERHKRKRLDFFCKHTLRYVPKNKPISIPKPPTKPAPKNVIDDCDGFNPLKTYSFPY